MFVMCGLYWFGVICYYTANVWWAHPPTRTVSFLVHRDARILLCYAGVCMSGIDLFWTPDIECFLVSLCARLGRSEVS